jgi:hypothetical protein
LDTEFARTLQARFNESADMDDDEEDDADMRDVENVLDKDTIARIMVSFSLFTDALSPYLTRSLVGC